MGRGALQGILLRGGGLCCPGLPWRRHVSARSARRCCRRDADSDGRDDRAPRLGAPRRLHRHGPLAPRGDFGEPPKSTGGPRRSTHRGSVPLAPPLRRSLREKEKVRSARRCCRPDGASDGRDDRAPRSSPPRGFRIYCLITLKDFLRRNTWIGPARCNYSEEWAECYNYVAQTSPDRHWFVTIDRHCAPVRLSRGVSVCHDFSNIHLTRKQERNASLPRAAN